MNTKRTRLVVGVLSALVLSAPLAMALAPNLIFTNFRGTLHVLQEVPCGTTVDVTTSIADGRMEITPSQQRSDRNDIFSAVLFDLTRVDIRIRRAGLDIDPGWVPWLARVVLFHYVSLEAADA